MYCIKFQNVRGKNKTKQACRQGGFKGVRGGSLEPHFCLLKILYTPFNHTFSALPFESGPLVSLLLRITARPNKSDSSYAGSFIEDQRKMCA